MHLSKIFDEMVEQFEEMQDAIKSESDFATAMSITREFYHRKSGLKITIQVGRDNGE